MTAYDRTGERIDDEAESGADLCRVVLEAANRARVCPYCGGQVKPGWTAHPSCRRAAEAAP
jgi:hypothetical protein